MSGDRCNTSLLGPDTNDDIGSWACQTHSIGDFLSLWLEKERLSNKNQATMNRYYYSYRKNFTDSIKGHYSSQVYEVESLIRDMVSPKLLEVGSGCGTEAIWFAMLGAEVLGIDLKQTRLDVAEERAKVIKKHHSINIGFKNESLFQAEFDEKFDIIWMEQAFHHIEPRQELPGKLHSMLNPGGMIVISEVNGLNLFMQARLFRKRGFKTIREYRDQAGVLHLYGDERIASARQIISLFKAHGFQCEKKRYFRCLPNFRLIESFSWIEKLMPKWFVFAFTHMNLVFKRK